MTHPVIVKDEPHPLTERQEAFAQELAKGMTYAAAYRAAGLHTRHSTAVALSAGIHSLAHHPAVRRRVTALRAQLDEEPIANLNKRIAWLRLITSADPNELTRVIRVPCELCWTDKAIAEGYAAHFADCPILDERPPVPETTKPEPNCSRCEGRGVRYVELTPNDELTPAGRALFKSATQNEKGVIKVEIQDQLAAAKLLADLCGDIVTRSMNLNANVAVQAARDVKPEELNDLLSSFNQ